MDQKEFIALGRELGYSGADLQAYVKEEIQYMRAERAAEREVARKAAERERHERQEIRKHEALMSRLSSGRQSVRDAGVESFQVTEHFSLQKERKAAREAAEREAARKAAERKAAREAADREAARKAADREAARKAAERKAAREAAEREAAREAAEREAAREAVKAGEVTARCFGCGKPGHLRKDCWLTRTQGNSSGKKRWAGRCST